MTDTIVRAAELLAIRKRCKPLRATKTLTVRVDKDLLTTFENVCEEYGITPEECLRRTVIGYVRKVQKE